MHYRIAFKNPRQHFIDIEYTVSGINTDHLVLQLPSWRPGRYELADYARNIQRWEAFEENGRKLNFRKTRKDRWEVECKGAKEVRIRYNYYAAEINAGSSYLDDRQLYVNPVNCCLYVPDRRNEPCTLELQLPDDYKVAGALKKVEKNIFLLNDFDQLADTPFIASNSLKHNVFILDGVEINIWLQGECKPDWPGIINDYFIFINEHFVLFKECPVDEFHFLIQVLPYNFFHGVEHLQSTVIALGPSYKFMRDHFNDFLGLSCHEFFHIWNVKTIRPDSMLPYDYSQESYSRLGYVYEGVTTYYGDYLLLRSGVFSEFGYFKTVYERLQRHFDNFGRFNLSVAESSFDTWLDGYTTGIPNRKTSIYDEGAITAFMTDILIRKNTKNKKSLDDVMRVLYYDFAKKGKGYSEQDYRNIVNAVAGTGLDDFFDDYIYGTRPYDSLIEECLSYIGCSLKHVPSKRFYEAHYGIKVTDNGTAVKVGAVYPGSPADKAGLAVNDEINSINGYSLKGDFLDWTRYFNRDAVSLMVSSGGIIREVTLHPSKDACYKNFYIEKNRNAAEKQRNNYYAWCKKRF